MRPNGEGDSLVHQVSIHLQPITHVQLLAAATAQLSFSLRKLLAPSPVDCIS